MNSMETYTMTVAAKLLTGSRKKTFFFNTGVTFSTASYWNGGSRREFLVRNLDNRESITPPCGYFPFTQPATYELSPREIMIETGVFNGKPATPKISCRPEDRALVLQYLGVSNTVHN